MREAFLIFVCILCFLGCSKDPNLRFDEDRELIVEGKITSSSDIDLRTIPISVIAFRSAGLFSGGSGDYAIIGNGFPDISGNYRIVSTFPENAHDIRVEINDWRHGILEDSLSRISLNDVDNLPLNNSTYSIPTLNLERVELFEIEIRRKESNLDTLIFSITSTSSIQIISIDRGGDIYGFDTMGGSSSRIKPEEVPRVYQRDIIKNSEIFINYAIRNNGIVKQEEFVIQTDGEENRFVFEY